MRDLETIARIAAEKRAARQVYIDAAASALTAPNQRQPKALREWHETPAHLRQKRQSAKREPAPKPVWTGAVCRVPLEWLPALDDAELPMPDRDLAYSRVARSQF